MSPGRPRAAPGARGAGERLVRGLVALGIVALLPGCAEPPPDLVGERLQASADSRAAEIIRTMLDAYGGIEAWRRHHTIEYIHRLEFHGGQEEPQVVTRQIHRFTLGGEVRAYIEDLETKEPQVVRLVDDVALVTRAGVPVLDPAQIAFPRAFSLIARRAVLQPWSLLDPGIDLVMRSPRTPPPAGRVPSEMCDVVRFTEAPAGQGAPSDWEDYYVSRLSHLIDRVHSYRGEDGAYRVTLWSDHRTVDGVRMATRRATHSSDVTGVVGALEVVVEYSDVRFDAPVEPESTAAAALPLEPAPSRE